MKKIIILPILVTIFALLSFAGADFFSSMTKADYVEGSKTLKFTAKLNTAHIADAVKINSNTTGFEAEVKKYVNSNFDLYINGAPKNLTFTGSQVNGESVWVYFEASGIDDINSIKIKNTILLGTYPKQINMVNISYKGDLKTMTFQRGKEVSEANF